MLLLFVILEVGFVATALVFAEPVLHELAWPAVLVGTPPGGGRDGGLFLAPPSEFCNKGVE